MCQRVEDLYTDLSVQFDNFYLSTLPNDACECSTWKNMQFVQLKAQSLPLKPLALATGFADHNE